MVSFLQASTLAGNAVGIVCGLYVDRFHRMKPSLVSLNVVNVVALVGFAIFTQVGEVSGDILCLPASALPASCRA